MPSMDLSKTLSTLKKQPSFIRTSAAETDLNVSRLEKMIDGWENEYYYMDHPIKAQRQSQPIQQQQPRPIPTITVDRPPSETPTIDKILLSLYDDN